MTPEEIQSFIDTDNIVLEATDSKLSYKTNFLIIKRNFDKLRLRLKSFHTFIVYLHSLIDTEAITANVIDYLTTNKSNVTVPFNILVDNSIIDGLYKITRLADNKITIEKQLNPTGWNVDNLIVSVKNVDGQIVYPVIITANNKIEIYFIDGISSNYKVLFI